MRSGPDAAENDEVTALLDEAAACILSQPGIFAEGALTEVDVAAHLETRGIAEERMLVHGAGSSVPIADNATRYGRSLNRRIVIEFSYPPD